MVATIAGTHHERWNGDGYPYGLEGEAIPLCGRIVAIADVDDTLRIERPYKPFFSLERSVDILLESLGIHFDPDVVTAFFDAFDDIPQIEREFSDLSGSPCEISDSQALVV